VIITETGGESRVRESGFDDSFFVRLGTEIPAGDTDTRVYVTVSAARSNQEEEDLDGDSILIRKSGDPADFLRPVIVNDATEFVPIRSIVLTFDSTNWNIDQEVFLAAASDLLAEGERVVTISHGVLIETTSASLKETYDQTPVRNVEVTVLDDDQPGLIITETDRETVVLEGNTIFDGVMNVYTGIRDEYEVQLTTEPWARRSRSRCSSMPLSWRSPAATRGSTPRRARSRSTT
jgi:hypothetical protein